MDDFSSFFAWSSGYEPRTISEKTSSGVSGHSAALLLFSSGSTANGISFLSWISLRLSGDISMMDTRPAIDWVTPSMRLYA